MRTSEAAAARRPITEHLEQLVRRVQPTVDGEPSPYGSTDPAACGVAICTVDGNLYSAGDANAPFPLQSISKAFTYALAVQDRGLPDVLNRINVEPSGERFNEISLVGEPPRPANPLVNIGAIAAAWCVRGDHRFPRILSFYEQLAGRALDVDEQVYTAETEAGARNRALGWLLTSAQVIDGPPDDALDAYTRQCSVLVTARDLAVMGATLANRGRQPVTGEQVLPARTAELLLSVMSTCGMYDDAGEWMIRVGMPAKSGVGGGILACAPGQLGIGTFGPPLDGHGSSVRGTLLCESLSHDFDLHFARVPKPHHATVRRVADVCPQARLVELQGDLAFLGIEAALHSVLTAAQDRPAVIVDVSRVRNLVTHAKGLLHQAGDGLRETGHQLLVVGGDSELGAAIRCEDVAQAVARVGAGADGQED